MLKEGKQDQQSSLNIIQLQQALMQAGEVQRARRSKLSMRKPGSSGSGTLCHLSFQAAMPF